MFETLFYLVHRMKFRKIIQSAKFALYMLLHFFCKRKRPRKHPPIVEENPENSEDQNPQNSPPEENAVTKETASPPKQPQESQPQIPIRDDDENVKSNEPDDPKHKSAAGQTSKQIKTPPKQSQTGQAGGKQDKEKPNQTGGKRGKEKPITTAENDNREAKPQPPQCRFVCYEETDGRWTVALAVEEGQDAQSVRQGNKEITAKDCRYILEDFAAEVTVKFKGEHSSKVLNLFDEHNDEHKFAVFKMRKNWQGEGQKVKTLSSGDYVVFAHKSCGQRIGKPPVEAAQCRYPDFTAHFFSVSENSERDGFENCSLPSPTKRFSLKGQRFPDDSDLGELFGNDAPQLDGAEEWRGISWIVVGRENGGKVLATFRPTKEKTLAEVLGERSGWFFVRIYDANVDLLHSFPFRRAKGLKNILVNEKPLGEVTPIVPTENGYMKTIVQFEGDLSVRPTNDSDGICKVTENKNTFAVLPHPNNDKTKWILGSGADCVESEILLPRMWWKFIKEKGEEGDWQDTPIKMERQAFRQAGNEKIRIRFSFRIPEIVVGFGDLNSPSERTFPTKLSKDRKTCEVELRLVYFANYQVIQKPLRKAVDLCVKVKDSDVVFPIVHIPKPKKIRIEGCNRKELKRAKEELCQEGLMDAAKAAEEFENSARGIEMTILFDNDKGHIVCTIRFDLQRKSMLDKIVKKLKAFFKKHFEKE